MGLALFCTATFNRRIFFNEKVNSCFCLFLFLLSCGKLKRAFSAVSVGPELDSYAQVVVGRPGALWDNHHCVCPPQTLPFPFTFYAFCMNELLQYTGSRLRWRKFPSSSHFLFAPPPVKMCQSANTWWDFSSFFSSSSTEHTFAEKVQVGFFGRKEMGGKKRCSLVRVRNPNYFRDLLRILEKKREKKEKVMREKSVSAQISFLQGRENMGETLAPTKTERVVRRRGRNIFRN